MYMCVNRGLNHSYSPNTDHPLYDFLKKICIPLKRSIQGAKKNLF